MKATILLVLVLLFSPMTACKKKERLSVSTFNFSITPPAATVVKNNSLTLTASGNSSVGPVEVSPTWTVSDESVGTLNTSIGHVVTFQANGLGDVTISALSDGIVAISQLAVVTYQPSANTFDVYNDDGLPSEAGITADIFTNANFLSELSSGYTPEGINYQRASNASTGNTWGVTLDDNSLGQSKDLSTFASGTLRFALRLARALESSEQIIVELTDAANVVNSFTLASGSNGYNRLGTGWQEISIPITSFSTINKSQVKVPFAARVNALGTSLTYDMDAVRWEK